eukprot:10942884-Alexandrium_andersonii.AAC.1
MAVCPSGCGASVFLLFASSSRSLMIRLQLQSVSQSSKGRTVETVTYVAGQNEFRAQKPA